MPHAAPPLPPDLFSEAHGRRDPLADLSRMVGKKTEILEALRIEREKQNPSEAIIAAAELWLRMFHDMSRTLAATPHYITRGLPPENDA